MVPLLGVMPTEPEDNHLSLVRVEWPHLLMEFNETIMFPGEALEVLQKVSERWLGVPGAPRR